MRKLLCGLIHSFVKDPGFQKYASVTVNDDSRRVVTLAVNCQGLISIDC